MKKFNNIILCGLPFLLIFAGIYFFPFPCPQAQAENPLPEEAVLPDSLVIVLDPGHGGDEEGGLYENFIEKDMNLIVANAMKEELEKYEGVTVYLTRTGDQKLSLAERSAFAKSVNADFMFCLHFNLSREHTLFGAECWVSAFGEEYSKGYSFASVEMQMLQELGLYSRRTALIITVSSAQPQNWMFPVCSLSTVIWIMTMTVPFARADSSGRLSEDWTPLPPQNIST